MPRRSIRPEVAPSRAIASGLEVAPSRDASSSREVAPGRDVASGLEVAPGRDEASSFEVAPGSDVASGLDVAPGRDVVSGMTSNPRDREVVMRISFPPLYPLDSVKGSSPPCITPDYLNIKLASLLPPPAKTRKPNEGAGDERVPSTNRHRRRRGQG